MGKTLKTGRVSFGQDQLGSLVKLKVYIRRVKFSDKLIKLKPPSLIIRAVGKFRPIWMYEKKTETPAGDSRKQETAVCKLSTVWDQITYFVALPSSPDVYHQTCDKLPLHHFADVDSHNGLVRDKLSRLRDTFPHQIASHTIIFR